MATESVEKHRSITARIRIDHNPFTSRVHSTEGETRVSIPDQRSSYLRHLASGTRRDNYHRLKLVACANHYKRPVVRTKMPSIYEHHILVFHPLAYLLWRKQQSEETKNVLL